MPPSTAGSPGAGSSLWRVNFSASTSAGARRSGVLKRRKRAAMPPRRRSRRPSAGGTRRPPNGSRPHICGAGAAISESPRLRRRSPLSRQKRKRSPGSSRRRWRRSRTFRSTTCRTGSTKPTMSSAIASGRCATTLSRLSSISTSAKRSARWISRPRQSSRARASWF